MKIAYLINVYNNPLHLNTLIYAISNSEVDVFLHIDKKSKNNFNLPKLKNLHVIENNIEVYWGGFSLIESILLLINKAKSYGKYNYYIWLSGSDYPIRSNKYIIDYLSKNPKREFINLCKMPENDKTFDRVDYYYISTIERNNHFTNKAKRLINIFVRNVNIKRKYPKEYRKYTLYGGSQWWALTDNAIEYILKFVTNNPTFIKFYKNTYIPDEMFFHTILGNSKFKKNIVNSLTYSDWRPYGGPLPAILSKEHLDILAKKYHKSNYGNGRSHYLFARKFSDKSGELIKFIEKKLRK